MTLAGPISQHLDAHHGTHTLTAGFTPTNPVAFGPPPHRQYH